MGRVLIVNADDCNLTRGVTQAILNAHDHGIVSSTTFLVNLPVDVSLARDLLRRKKLGVGLHLNITLGKPVTPARRVLSLLRENGSFKKTTDVLSRPKAVYPGEIEREYESQVRLFRSIFGRLPTHFDTHHQLHDDPHFYRVLCAVAKRHRLPVRRSALMRLSRRGAALSPPPSTAYLFGNLRPENYWRRESLGTLLKNLPEGVSEIACHPGKNDRCLRDISSFTAGREVEWRLFRSASLRKQLAQEGITLSHYGLCYNRRR